MNLQDGLGTVSCARDCFSCSLCASGRHLPLFSHLLDTAVSPLG